MTSVQTKPYGTWSSPITADRIAAGGVRIDETGFTADGIYWIEVRPREQGRSALMFKPNDSAATEVVRAPFSARTRVHEYGGGSFAVVDGNVIFANFADQRLYRVAPGGEPAVLAGEDGVRFADFCHDRGRNRLVCIREDHRGERVINTLVAVDLTSGAVTVLAEGNDFYSTPRVSPDGTQLAWLTWNFPNMPWDGTELWVGSLTADGSIGAARLAAGGAEESIFQPEWSPAGDLHFISDHTDWWNIYRLDGDRATALHTLSAEFGLPQWVMGMSMYGFLADGRIACCAKRNDCWRLCILSQKGALRDLELDINDISEVRTSGDQILILAGSPWQGETLMLVDPESGAVTLPGGAPENPIDRGYISAPETIEFPTTDGRTAFALYYGPRNKDFRAPAGERPPLIVMSHGGPTGSAQASLVMKTQYWTSRGFAVVDVNFCGSTGYGREYRNRLRDNWGIVDVDDCANAARYLIEQGRVDGNRLSITGGSAGGYTTLAALTFTDIFKAGASYFGIADLEAMARDTHKFESRYLDMLVAPYPSGRDVYLERSPIHFTDRLSCPMILFQGLEDKVVPPNQAEMMTAALRAKGLPVACLMFAGEGHGFRRAETTKTCLQAHLYFLGKVFGFTPADELPPVEIENFGYNS